jgi:hypothetical protein
MALPLPIGRKVESAFVLGALSDVLSALGKFSFRNEEPQSIFIFSCLAFSAISTSSDFIAVFAPVNIS